MEKAELATATEDKLATQKSSIMEEVEVMMDKNN